MLANDHERAIWRDGWSAGRLYTREFLGVFYPWAQLRRQLSGLVKDPALTSAERSAYRQVLRLMVGRMNKERKVARRRYDTKPRKGTP